MLDSENNRVEVFDAAGEVLATWGLRGDRRGRVLPADGDRGRLRRRVYVADTNNNRVEHFTIGRAHQRVRLRRKRGRRRWT